MPPSGGTRRPASVSASRYRSPQLAVVPAAETRPADRATQGPRAVSATTEPASAVARWLPFAGGIAVVVVVTIVVAIVAVQLGAERSDRQSATGAQPAATRPGAGATNSGGQRLQGMTPAGWQKYLDIQYGYEVAVPSSWEPVQDRVGRAAFRDPTTGAFARIERTERPLQPLEREPKRAEQTYADRDYRRIRLDATMFKGVQAAEWEFVFTNSRVRWHAADLHLLVDGVGYAISFQVPENFWPAARATMASIRASFGTGGQAG